VFSSLFKSKWKYWLLLIAGLIFIAYQADICPRTDDDYLGEQVYWLMHTGRVKSDFGYTVLGYDTYQSIFHKLYVYLGYLSSEMFGWSLLSLHLVSLFFFAVFVALFYRWCEREYGTSGDYRFYGVLLLLLFNQDFLYACADFRPEILLMSLGFASYILLLRYLEKNTVAALAGAGICAGLAMFAHLNGAIFIVAGIVLLAYSRRFSAVAIFLSLAILAFLPYFFDVIYNADFGYFRRQFLNDPILTGQHRYWYTPLLKLVEEQSRFLYNEKQVVLTLILIVVLAGAFRKLKTQQALLLLYTLTLIIAMAFINPSKTTKYMVVYLPFLYLIVMEGWRILAEEEGRKKWLRALQALLIISVGISLFYSVRKIGENVESIRTGGVIRENERILAAVPGDLSALHFLGPRAMVFNNIGRLKRLQDIEMISKEELTNFLKVSDVDYLVFSLRDQAYFDLPELLSREPQLLQVCDRTQHYVLVKVNRKG